MIGGTKFMPISQQMLFEIETIRELYVNFKNGTKPEEYSDGFWEYFKSYAFED